MEKIIEQEKSVIPACDVPIDVYEEIVKETSDVDGIGGYKIGFQLGLTHGLPEIVERTREYNDKPIIYDHQKAGTDIPATGQKFAETVKKAGVDAVILFPQAGPETEKAWIESALVQDLGVIVGSLMTHKGYVRSEGGYLADESIREMYMNAAEAGVSDFVVPGNKPGFIRKTREDLEQNGVSPTFYAPGFVAQGGSISDATEVAGDNWHAIVGRGIYQADDKKWAAIDLTREL